MDDDNDQPVLNAPLAAMSVFLTDLARIIHHLAPDTMEDLLATRRRQVAALEDGTVDPDFTEEADVARLSLLLIEGAMGLETSSLPRPEGRH